jgi:HK97 family phage major capsid protein
MMSRLLLLQSSPSIEQIARNDLAASLGVAVDLAALSGSGASSQPLGIAQATGVSFVLAGSGNGGNLTLDVVIAMERKANEGNMPMAGRAYFVNPKAASTLKTLKSSTGQYLWTDSPTGQRSATPHMLNGYPVFITNQVRGTLTAGTSVGVCSEIFFACWPEVVIGEWGSLEIVVNPYRETGFAAGAVWVRAMQTLDVALRRSASLVMCTDALTP